MLLTVVLCDGLQARQIDVVAGEGVQAAIDKAEPGDVVRLLKGKHNGAVTIDRAIELSGEPCRCRRTWLGQCHNGQRAGRDRAWAGSAWLGRKHARPQFRDFRGKNRHGRTR